MRRSGPKGKGGLPLRMCKCGNLEEDDIPSRSGSTQSVAFIDRKEPVARHERGEVPSRGDRRKVSIQRNLRSSRALQL